MLSGNKWELYQDNRDRSPQYQVLPAQKGKQLKVTLQADGGFIIVGQ